MTPDPMGAAITRERAWALLTTWTTGESLLKHALAVESAVRGYARRFGEDELFWGNTALLHDFDYEKYPDLADHPFKGADILRGEGFPEAMIRAILSHGDHTGVARESRLEHTLFACDELSGFVVAAALVRPSKSVLDLEVSSVKKRMKDKAFARNIPREDLQRGADELGLPLEEHIGHVIAALREAAEPLGLKGTL
jgi:putative nucleotidyltransferase with HDIG domain